MSYKSGSKSFQSLADAKKFAQRVFARTGSVVAITETRRQTAKQAAYLFFLRNAGVSYDPARETRQQGRAAGARRLAKAERDARALGYTFEWRDDWGVGSHVKEFGAESYPKEPQTCECCVMRNAGGTVVQALGCVDDATREYRRVVEAELALEELGAGMAGKDAN